MMPATASAADGYERLRRGVKLGGHKQHWCCDESSCALNASCMPALSKQGLPGCSGNRQRDFTGFLMAEGNEPRKLAKAGKASRGPE